MALDKEELAQSWSNYRVFLLVAIGAIVAIGVMGSAYSPDNAPVILGFCGVITTSLLQHLQQIRTDQKVDKVAAKAQEAAEKVDEVKSDLKSSNSKTERKLDEIAKVGLETKEYTNSAMGQALKLTAVATRATADATGKPTDIKIAEQAEEASARHDASKDAVTGKAVADTKTEAKEQVDASAEEIKEKIEDI